MAEIVIAMMVFFIFPLLLSAAFPVRGQDARMN